MAPHQLNELHVFSEVEKRGHEQVAYFYFPEVGLKAIIAIHSTVLGPALGGCRMRLYDDETKALDDALRLAEGMTYKSSLAGLDLGGGKAVLVADPSMMQGRRELFLKFGECVDALKGRYITAEDMGTSVNDIMIAREKTAHVSGIAPEFGGGGDPSPWTAIGVFKSIVDACERRYSSTDLSKRVVAVQGVGHVGLHLVRLLREAGARVVATDMHHERCEEARMQYGVEVVGADSIYSVPCDVFSPCAAGQIINAKTVGELTCKIIAGAANNQLIDSSMHKALTDRGILYCPDFVVNAGGVINVGAEYVPGGHNKAWVAEKVNAIYTTIHQVLDASEKRKKFPEIVAVELAKERIAAKRASSL